MDGVILRISNASLGFEIADSDSRTVVKVTKAASLLDVSDDEEIDSDGVQKVDELALCALIPGKVRLNEEAVVWSVLRVLCYRSNKYC